MNGKEFVRRARRYARKNGLDFNLDPSRGRGNHSKLTIGDKSTTVQHGEIAPRTLASMFRQLQINRREF